MARTEFSSLASHSREVGRLARFDKIHFETHVYHAFAGPSSAEVDRIQELRTTASLHGSPFRFLTITFPNGSHPGVACS